MDLGIKDQLFLVGGATSGFGRAVAEALAAEGAHVIAVARSAEQLKLLQEKHKGQVETICLISRCRTQQTKLLML